MKIVVVGAGPVGIITSILIKRKYPLFDVVILEQLDKPLKKLKATGNGKCNFLNKGNLSSETYFYPFRYTSHFLFTIWQKILKIK